MYCLFYNNEEFKNIFIYITLSLQTVVGISDCINVMVYVQLKQHFCSTLRKKCNKLFSGGLPS